MLAGVGKPINVAPLRRAALMPKAAAAKGPTWLKPHLKYTDEGPKSLASVVPFLRRHETASQFLAFLAVGILNTAFGYGVFAGLYLLGVSHRVAIVVATGAGVGFNYFTTGRLVFTGLGAWTFVRFVLTYAVICLVNILLVDAATARGISALSAQLFALLIVVPLSFAGNKWFAFGGRR
jgi:putative flippase GtrA